MRMARRRTNGNGFTDSHSFVSDSFLNKCSSTGKQEPEGMRIIFPPESDVASATFGYAICVSPRREGQIVLVVIKIIPKSKVFISRDVLQGVLTWWDFVLFLPFLHFIRPDHETERRPLSQIQQFSSSFPLHPVIEFYFTPCFLFAPRSPSPPDCPVILIYNRASWPLSSRQEEAIST